MKLFAIILFSLLFKNTTAVANPSLLVNSQLDKSSVSEEAVALLISSTLKLIEKGYVPKDVIKKTISSIEKSKNFKNFIPLFSNLDNFISIPSGSDLLPSCRNILSRSEKLPIENNVNKLVKNYCLDKVLQQISRNFDKKSIITDEEFLFIKDNLKYYLSENAKKSFSFFLQFTGKDKNILKKISQMVTDYSVINQAIPSQEVLQDMEINEQITKLIQIKGFNPLQHQNVFYAEFAKLIEQGYKLINVKNDEKIDDKKIANHFQFLKNFIELNQDHLPLDLCLTRLNDLSKSIYRTGNLELSRSIFDYVIKKNDKTILQDALFSYLWTYIRINDFNGALEFAKKHHLLKQNSEINDPRIKFWISHALEKKNDINLSFSHYEDIIYQNPLSFYSIMASKRLASIKPNSTALNFYLTNSKQPHEFKIKFSDLDEDHIASLNRLKIWTKINHIKFKELELKRLETHSTPNFIVKFPTDQQASIQSELHLIQATLMQSSNYLSAFKYLYEAFEQKKVQFNRTLIEILYPKPFLGELKKILSSEDIDPIILLSLIRQESVFNPLARSPVGARGLMQLMPTTAKRIRRGISSEQLNNPRINMEIGIKYFKNLLRRYDNNLVYVLSAYNAGENRVERWKNMYWDSEANILRNIEEIPFLETRNYVKLIFRNIFFYKMLDDSLIEVDKADLNKIYNITLGFKH